MTGAVAFVFGLCALSFAAGCVVTVVMLRWPDPVSTPVEPPALPVEAPGEPERVEQWEPRQLNGDISAKPIHRNPVQGLALPKPAPVVEPEPAPVPEPELEPDAEEVPVVPAQPAPLVGTSEFRQRYLRTFAATRRRSSR